VGGECCFFFFVCVCVCVCVFREGKGGKEFIPIVFLFPLLLLDEK